jgi:hypothetical protein
MSITTAQYKAAVEAKISAATSGTSLDDLTLIKSNADLWLLNNPGGSITGYSSLESLIQTKQNALTGSSTLDDITLTGVSAFPATSGSVIKSIQSDFVNTGALSKGTNSTEDAYYLDVTISAVNTAKAVIKFDGGIVRTFSAISDATSNPMIKAVDTASATDFFVLHPTARLTSATNLRISGYAAGNLPAAQLAGRYTVIEYV